MKPQISSAILAMAMAPLAYSSMEVHSTSFEVGQGLVLEGAGFGSGPEVAVHDDFHHGGRAGQEVDTNSALSGRWSGANRYYPTLYSDMARRGSHAAQMFDKDAGRARALTKVFDEPVQTVFVSYWVRLADNRMFPGSNVPGGAGHFSDDSSWKFTWLIDEDASGSNTDICLPTHIGNGNFMLAGNSHNLTHLGNDWWVWDDWMRISVSLEPDFNDPIGSGQILFQTLSEERGLEERRWSRGIFPDNSHRPNQFQKINVPGWVRTNDSTSAVIYYDDIYVATGPDASARVEIGNKDRYVESTELLILSHVEWNDNRIVVKVPDYLEDKLADSYLYVTGGDGDVNNSGISIGTSAPAVIDEFEVE